MQLAIYLNGPIGAGYTVYRDFKYYKSGIYYHYGRSLSVPFRLQAQLAESKIRDEFI